MAVRPGRARPVPTGRAGPFGRQLSVNGQLLRLRHRRRPGGSPRARAAGAVHTPSSLPDATLGIGYSTALAAAGGSAPYSWSVASGALPPGLGLDPSTGAITGTPTAVGSYPFTVSVSDSSSPNLRGTSTSRHHRRPVPTRHHHRRASRWAGGASVLGRARGTGGTAPYAWSVTSGALPAGLALDASTGAITGTPVTPGTSSFTVTARDADSTSTSAALAIAVTGSGRPPPPGAARGATP